MLRSLCISVCVCLTGTFSAPKSPPSGSVTGRISVTSDLICKQVGQGLSTGRWSEGQLLRGPGHNDIIERCGKINSHSQSSNMAVHKPFYFSEVCVCTYTLSASAR